MATLLMIGPGLFFVEVEPATHTAPNPVLGNLIAIAAGVSLALGLMGLRRLGRVGLVEGADQSGAAALAGNVLATLVCLPFMRFTSCVQGFDVFLIVYLGAVRIGLAYWILTRGLRRVPAVQVSLLLLAEPVLNAIWVWIVLGEEPGFWSLVGCALILIATYFRVAVRGGGSSVGRTPAHPD